MHSLSSSNSQSWLSWFLRVLLILLFLILITKFVEVQIIKGGYYRTLSAKNMTREVTIPAKRGRILARGGEVLAGNIEIKKSIRFTDSKGFILSDDLTGVKSEEIVSDYKRYYPMGDKFSHALGYLSQPSEEEVEKINPECPEKGIVERDSS